MACWRPSSTASSSIAQAAQKVADYSFENGLFDHQFTEKESQANWLSELFSHAPTHFKRAEVTTGQVNASGGAQSSTTQQANRVAGQSGYGQTTQQSGPIGTNQHSLPQLNRSCFLPAGRRA